jgi:hypothetical protein
MIEDKIEEYRKDNPDQLDIFHIVPDVKELDYESYIRSFRRKKECIMSMKNYTIVDRDMFKGLLEDRIKLIIESLDTKGEEYAGEGRQDRMHNFIVASQMNRETPERSLHGMLTKHIVSYQDMLDNLDSGVVPTKEYIKEKFGDIINYFIISEMLFLNRIE